MSSPTSSGSLTQAFPFTMFLHKIQAFRRTKVAAQFVTRIFGILFYLHLCLVAGFVVLVNTYGTVTYSNTNHFHPLKWYPPLLASTGCGAIVGFAWQCITAGKPRTVIRATFWMSPLLTTAMGVMFVYMGTVGSLVIGIATLVSAFIQSLYGCWVSPRFEYAAKALSDSVANPPPKSKVLALASILIGIFYCCLLVSGIGGVRSLGNRIKLAPVFIFVILLSMAWTMYFLKNAMVVAISRVQYMHFAGGDHMKTGKAFGDTIKNFTGSISIGSILVPIIGLFRSLVRSTNQINGDHDECGCSCAGCYMGIASILVNYGNRWGFVHVGVHNKGIVRASHDTWEMFNRVGMEELIDLDLTGAFCFLSGVGVGAISSLVSGIWCFAIHQSYAIEEAVYGFLIGYFMCRLALAWPQACLSAYYVAYAENPQSNQFSSTIPTRIEQIHRSQAVQLF